MRGYLIICLLGIIPWVTSLALISDQNQAESNTLIARQRQGSIEIPSLKCSQKLNTNYPFGNETIEIPLFQTCSLSVCELI